MMQPFQPIDNLLRSGNHTLVNVKNRTAYLVPRAEQTTELHNSRRRVGVGSRCASEERKDLAIATSEEVTS